MGLFQKIKEWFKRSKKGKIKDFRILKNQAGKELDELRKNESKDESLEKLNRIFRIFIDERYELKRSLTYEELSKEIITTKINSKIKGKIIRVSSKMYQITYKNEPKTIDSLLKEIISIVKKS